MSSSAGSFFVPTLDIDLAWHTHQLNGPTYHANCSLHIGRFIDQYVYYHYQCFVAVAR